MEATTIKGPSLTIKWAFASSLFIFIVFTLFAIITYKSSVDLIITREKAGVERTVKEAQVRLSEVNKKLTYDSAFQELQINLGKATPSIAEKNQKIGIYADPFLSGLYQESLSFYVYDTDKKMIFTTSNNPLSLQKNKNMPINILTLNEQMGFLTVQEVKSKATGKLIGYIQVFYQMDDYFSIRSQLLIILLILELVSLLISSVLGYFLSSYFLKPIAILRDTMLAVHDDPKNEVYMKKINTNDELEDLAEIFNEMMKKMRSYIELQEQFVSDVSHELRTPVAIIEGHLSMLNRWGKNEPEILDEGLKASLHEIKRMKSLVQDMLNLSRAGVIDPSFKDKSCNASEVIEQVVNNFKLLYPHFELNYSMKITTQKETRIYRDHLEQIAIIILENAIKYSAAIEKVDIVITNTEKSFVLSVKDYGEGMTADEKEKIFGRFYRVDKARARSKGGNGLGLSIAKQFIENYRGKIEVESVLNEGTTFHIHLPLVD